MHHTQTEKTLNSNTTNEVFQRTRNESIDMQMFREV